MFLSTPALAAGTSDDPSPRVKAPSRTSALPKLERPKPQSGLRARTALRAAGPQFDVDGDGIDDMLSRDMDGTVLVEASTIHDFTPYQIYGDDYEETSKDILTPGNLDGSGGPEVLTLSATGTLALYQSWGVDGTGPATWSGKGWQIYNKVVTPGDVTGDGKPDLLARTYGGDLYLYQGTGSVSTPFRARVLVGGGWSMFDQLVGMADMNGDGIGDVVARTPAGDLYFYAGKGSTTSPLAARVKIGGGWTTYNQIVAAYDWDGDGLSDLFGRTASGDLYLYLANGTGGFVPRQKLGTGWNGADLFAGSGAVPRFGKTDMIGRDSAGTLYWYGALNNGLFAGRQKISDTGGFAGARLAFASSLDKDTYADLVELYDGRLYNSATGLSMSSGWGKYNLFLGPGDLNDDGKGDLLARDGSGNLYLFRGKGDGASLASPLKIGGGWNAYNALVGAGDFTGDGRADIVARTPSGTLYLYRGTGNSSAPFAGRVTIGNGWQQYSKLASPGDMDGDNRADLVATDSGGTLYRYSSYGSGKFKARVKVGGGWNTYKNLY
ncbi:VCBS repeat-containing protein [Streptomyces mexicanus]|uniref:VCBS repeat-containing protein n=2 Tax=Streptomyces mexicanus TaxID=178566 RepID=A0A7X1LTZ2_9ACTN|nr:VCBS repeat-containing protein [Streptomyces mexicanus]